MTPDAPATISELGVAGDGLSEREAARRLTRWGRNELPSRKGVPWQRRLGRQFTHPLAVLLWAAAVLALATGTPVLAAAVVVVIIVNALFAFAQEEQAQRAVHALQGLLANDASVIREGRHRRIPVGDVVPGDLLLVAEGDRIPADAQVVEGGVEVDMATLTGESIPVERSATASPAALPALRRSDLLFSGTVCLAGEARAVVVATGARTELGRIAALSESAAPEESPLERQVRRAAFVIAAVAIGAGLVFLPLGVVAAGLSLRDSTLFAVGLLVANVPEGLLPTITLALAVGVRVLAQRGAIVKRLSAVETLGSTTVICTDKTGTVTENRLQVVEVWLPDTDDLAMAVAVMASCNNADIDGETAMGDPTEISLLHEAGRRGADTSKAARDSRRVRQLRFDSERKLMSVVEHLDGRLVLLTKGAPEEVLRCAAAVPATARHRVEQLAAAGHRVLALAWRDLSGLAPDADRDVLERQLLFLGLVALRDNPRPEVKDAVARCHAAGIRVIMLTGDHPATAAAVAADVGIGGDSPRVVTGEELDQLSDAQLDDVLRHGREPVFARVSPEDKLRVADSLRDLGEVVAMTGDGVNDAPVLHRADIGVAMGEFGTDVAREAATMILTDDNFATIVTAVEEGRRVWANIRKFVFYIFVHAPPEVIPFLVFALAGGRVPLPLTVMEILAIDLGTEILPALALGREPAEPGTMDRPPRPAGEQVIDRALLMRAWVVLGLSSAVIVLGEFFWVLRLGGWHPGVAVGAGSSLHHVYLQATTAVFLAIVACQVGTAFAARTERSSLRSVGLLSNPPLVAGVAVEVLFAAAVAYLSPFQVVFSTAAPPWQAVVALLPVPIVIWGIDELRRLRRRQSAQRASL